MSLLLATTAHAGRRLAHLADRLQSGEAELEVRRSRVLQLAVHAVEQLKDALQGRTVGQLRALQTPQRERLALCGRKAVAFWVSDANDMLVAIHIPRRDSLANCKSHRRY